VAVDDCWECLARLPSVLAIPLEEYAAESHAVMKLHRFCDAAEILTRFSSVVVLAELRAQHGDHPLPDEVRDVLRRHIECPTFGNWVGILEVAAKSLAASNSLVLPEMLDFVNKHLLTALKGEPPVFATKPESDIVDLRNVLVHGGAKPQVWAEQQLRTYGPCLEKTLVPGLAFLESCDLCWLKGGEAQKLAGLQVAGRPRSLSAALTRELRDLDGHVVLLRDERPLNLWPLCDYGPATRRTFAEGPQPVGSPGPLIFYRVEYDRLLYAALGGEYPISERSDALEEFHRLFRPRLPKEPDGGLAVDYEEEIRSDAAKVVGRGRLDELKKAKDLLKEATSGVFWLSGPGGIGKSFFMAKLADDLRGDPKKKDLRIAWRFKASHGERCSRAAFFRHAIAALASWLNVPDSEIPLDVDQQFGKLRQLLDKVAAMQAEPPRRRARRALFILDGLDEIASQDSTFPEIPFLLSGNNVVWLCAGRPDEGRLPQIFAPDRATHVFPGGLPAMSKDDIRGMLLEGTHERKYECLGMDKEKSIVDSRGVARTVVENDALDAVNERAAGLPLFVRFVVEDVKSRQFDFADFVEKLPDGLSAYYDDLLRRLSISDLHATVSPVVVALAWAHAPLDEETLRAVMVHWKKIRKDDPTGLLRRALDAIQSLVWLTNDPFRGCLGYELYHPTFRKHIRDDRAKNFVEQNAQAADEFCEMVKEWASFPRDHSARAYALRYGPKTLIESERWGDLESLLTDLPFLEAKTEAGQVFDLVGDFAAAVAAMPAKRPCRRILELLEEAIARDIHFIHRHREDYPQALFQCLWNSCWWYDCAEASEHYDPPAAGWPAEGPPWRRPGTKLSKLLESWRVAKMAQTPDLVWLRSLRPPPIPLGCGLLRILTGHEGAVTSLAISPDGQCIASGSDDTTIKVWETSTGRELLTLEGHTSGVNCLAYSPDGTRIASGSDSDDDLEWQPGNGGELALWDASIGSNIFTRNAGYSWGGIFDVAFSSDGCQIATCGGDCYDWVGPPSVWNASTGEVVRRLLEDTDWDTISEAVGDNGGSRIGDWIELLETAGESFIPFDGHRGRGVSCEAFSPDGRRVAVARGNVVELWDPVKRKKANRENLCTPRGRANREELRRELFPKVMVFYRGLDAIKDLARAGCVEFSRDGQRIASASGDKTIEVWDASTGRLLDRLKGHTSWVTSLTFSPDGGRLVSGSWDTTVRVWDAVSNRVVHTLARHTGPVLDILFSRDGKTIASVSRDGTVKIWDLTSGALLESLVEGDRRRVAWVAGSTERWFELKEDRAPLVDPPNPGVWIVDEKVPGMLDANGRRIRAVKNAVKVSDERTGEELLSLEGHREDVIAVAISADGQRIASASHDTTVKLWNASTGREIRTFNGHRGLVACLAFSRDGQQIASGSADSSLILWDVATGRDVHTLKHKTAVSCVAFGPHGRRIASGSVDGVVKLWDVRSGSQIGSREVGDNEIRTLTFVADGTGVVVNGIRMWDTSAQDASSGRTFRASTQVLGTAIEDVESNLAIAWFAADLRHLNLATSPSGRAWAASVNGDLCVFVLEGDPAGSGSGTTPALRRFRVLRVPAF
jgi:WD40 repeat protein